MSTPISEDRLPAIEERRFVVLLGILTLFIAYRAELPHDFPYPLPYPIPHLQIFVLPLFDRFVLVFGIYAVFMFAYFSEPLYSTGLRETFRRAAWMTLMGYAETFVYISSGLLVSIFVPDWLILPYALVFGFGLLLVWLSLFEYLSERKRLIRRAVQTVLSRLRTARLWIPRVFNIQFLRRLGKRLLVYLRKHLPRVRPLKTLKNVQWKYLVYAVGTVILIWLSSLLVANPQPYLVLAELFPIVLGAGILLAVKGKRWVRPYSTFLTWVGITMGGIASDQISRSIISLAPFAESNWPVVIGLVLFVVIIAMITYFVDIFRSQAFVVDASKT